MKSILLPALLFLSLLASGQNWALPSSRWKNIVSGFWGSSSVGTWVVEKDTVVESITCAKIASDIHPYESIYSYSSPDTVFVYRDSAFRPLFYFNVNAGDTIMVYNDRHSSCCANVQYWKGRVDSVGLIQVNGQNLKSITVSIVDSLFANGPGYPFIYAEKIGLLRSYFNPFYQSTSSMADGNVYDFCNYGDSSITGFWLYPDSNCRIRTAVDDIANDQAFRVYPNPAIDLVHVNTQEVKFQILIYDATGRIIIRQENIKDISVKGLTPGLYFAVMRTNTYSSAMQKFIKQ